MFNQKKSLNFLKRLTFFRGGNKQPRVDTYENLVGAYHQQEHNPEEANLIAQNLSVQYGVAGLYFYIPLKLTLLGEDKSHEIIAQELLQLLSLIFYMERYVTEPTERTWVEEQKARCRDLCDNETEAKEVFEEATSIETFYPR